MRSPSSGCSTSCCGGQPLAYLRRDVPDGRDVGSRTQGPHKVADVPDAAGGGEPDGQVQCRPPDGYRLHGLALSGIGGREQGEVKVLGFAGIWWLLSAHMWFTGPKFQGSAEEMATIEAELESLGYREAIEQPVWACRMR